MATNFFGIDYHFKLFRSQVATEKQVNFMPWEEEISVDESMNGIVEYSEWNNWGIEKLRD